MGVEFFKPLAFSLALAIIASAWVLKYGVARRGRRYSKGRQAIGRDDRFRIDLQVKLPASKSVPLGHAPVERRKLVLGIRPEDIYERQLYNRSVDGNAITARVSFLEQLGNEVLATCALGERELVVRLSPRTGAQSDQPLDLVFDMGQAKLFDPSTGAAV